MKKPTKRENEILAFLDSIVAEKEIVLTNYKHSTNKIVAQEVIISCEKIRNFITDKG